ncbi:MAG: homocysteine S-methyltransferase [Oscillibacter sp.]|nr:homocysteine S-methyltransferase [Oscillibacter sp.]
MDRLQEALQECGRLVIDGSMSAALEHLGCKLNDKLWTARVLAEHPEMVKEVHLQYLRAGADCHITCSYQATVPGLLESGFSQPEAEEIIRRSVRAFYEAREQWLEREGGKDSGRVRPICLAGIGPYGAYLADGSEFVGGYGVDDKTLRTFHESRVRLLLEEKPDYLLFETMPCFREVLIAAELAEEAEADYWVSFSCLDGKRICEGDEIRTCAEALSKGHPHLKAIGVNCVKPRFVESLIRELRAGCDLPIVAYPNSGETWNPVKKIWYGGAENVSFKEYALRYYAAGAAAVGGCCTTADSHIRQVAEARREFLAV